MTNLAFLEVKVEKTTDVGTHTIFIGKVVNCGVVGDGEPMTYAFYHKVKKGKTPEKAPTYDKDRPAETEAKPQEATGEEADQLKKYKCSVCGYIYDPAAGDPDNGVEPGTAFENLPDDWVCPVCGATKDSFAPED